LRFDPLTGTPVLVVRARQSRPNLPRTITRAECPFCPGGLEAPEPYVVRWFDNRWPPLPGGRAEIVLFSPDHDQSLGSLPRSQMLAVIGLWTERTLALGSRDDVDYVIVFENRGAEVGATIPHPHGQIYAFDFVPPAPLSELEGGKCAICDELGGTAPAGPSHAGRVVSASGGWQVWAAWAPSYPFELLVAPEEHAGDLPAARSHDGLAEVLRAGLGALDGLFDEQMPYMMWCHQKPTDGSQWPCAHVHFHVAPTHRAKGVVRYVASGELGTGIMFNPVDPDDAASRLREALAR
jgi:UDPglucose--hexose-1-phosphate uridylyltransferase